jgi:transposase
MSRGYEVPETVRAQIVILKQRGDSWAWIGSFLGVHPETARKVYERWEETRCFSSAPRAGRPKSFDERDVRHLARHITSSRDTRRQALGEIKNALNLTVCPKTLRNVITKDIGLGHRIERKKPWLRPEQKLARLKFATEHINWTEEEWKRVVWSDEMGMQIDANQGFKWVWRYPEEEYNEDCCRGTVISGFRKVKVWGAMRYGKLSKLIVVPEREGGGKMDSHDYVDYIMDGEMFDFWMESSEELGQVVMMEDGAGYHQRAASVRRKQLEEDGWIGWGPGSWPSSSPDLNPIENLWHILRSNIRKRKIQPRNEEQLVVALQEEWEKLDMELVNRLCLSMPRRLQAVIDAGGGITKY